MKYIHLGCLNQWRRLSTNPNSYIECDQCKYRYDVSRVWWAEFIKNTKFVNAVTFTILLILVFSVGFCVRPLQQHDKFWKWVRFHQWSTCRRKSVHINHTINTSCGDSHKSSVMKKTATCQSRCNIWFVYWPATWQ